MEQKGWREAAAEVFDGMGSIAMVKLHGTPGGFPVFPLEGEGSTW